MTIFHHLLFALLALASTSAFAQDGSVRMPVSKVSGGGSEGFFLGAQYSNFSLLGAKVTTENSAGEKTDQDISQSINGNLSGISFGYKDLKTGEVGGDFAASYLGSMNSSDSLNGLSVLQLVANLNYSFGLLHAFAGANATAPIFRDTEGISSTPGIGAQIGVGLQMNGFYATVGYNLMRFAKKAEFTSLTGISTTQSRVTYSGIAGQLGYLF